LKNDCLLVQVRKVTDYFQIIRITRFTATRVLFLFPCFREGGQVSRNHKLLLFSFTLELKMNNSEQYPCSLETSEIIDEILPETPHVFTRPQKFGHQTNKTGVSSENPDPDDGQRRSPMTFPSIPNIDNGKPHCGDQGRHAVHAHRLMLDATGANSCEFAIQVSRICHRPSWGTRPQPDCQQSRPLQATHPCFPVR
jgi:hypothetical protein